MDLWINDGNGPLYKHDIFMKDLMDIGIIGGNIIVDKHSFSL